MYFLMTILAVHFGPGPGGGHLAVEPEKEIHFGSRPEGEASLDAFSAVERENSMYFAPEDNSELTQDE